MTPKKPEPWLEVLNGSAPPTDRETREADGMRQYFEARLEADLATMNDPARERRLRNLVEARFAAQAQAEQKQSAKPVNPLRAWFESLQLGWPALGAAAAAVVLGVLVGPLFQSQSAGDDEWATPKALPTEQMGTTPPDVSTPKSFNPNTAATPQEFASLVRSALAPLGVDIKVESAADGLRLSANIPKDQRSAAAEAIKPLGLEVPIDGRLRVLIR